MKMTSIIVAGLLSTAALLFAVPMTSAHDYCADGVDTNCKGECSYPHPRHHDQSPFNCVECQFSYDGSCIEDYRLL